MISFGTLFFLLNFLFLFISFQCYDTSGLFIEQSDNISLPPSHGPPPSYDMVVALDEIVARRTNKNCQLHQNLTMENYCPFTTSNDFKTCSNFREKNDNENFNGSLRFKTTNQNEYENNREQSDIICSICDKTVSNTCSCNLSNENVNIFIENNNNNNNNSNNNDDDVNGNCICNDFLHNDENLVNVPSTSTQHSNFYDENFNNNIIDFENCNENGLVRMDMSQIIDNTGLPTYEAALKLESSGYV